MKPWNPYAMTFHGQPIVGQTPPKLVVHGPPLTARQGGMLQTAYTAFASAARTSIVPNPSRQGHLPDGSRYSIECTAGVCTCTVWTAATGKAYGALPGTMMNGLVRGNDLSALPLRHFLSTDGGGYKEVTGFHYVPPPGDQWYSTLNMFWSKDAQDSGLYGKLLQFMRGASAGYSAYLVRNGLTMDNFNTVSGVVAFRVDDTSPVRAYVYRFDDGAIKALPLKIVPIREIVEKGHAPAEIIRIFGGAPIPPLVGEWGTKSYVVTPKATLEATAGFPIKSRPSGITFYSRASRLQLRDFVASADGKTAYLVAGAEPESTGYKRIFSRLLKLEFREATTASGTVLGCDVSAESGTGIWQYTPIGLSGYIPGITKGIVGIRMVNDQVTVFEVEHHAHATIDPAGGAIFVKSFVNITGGINKRLLASEADSHGPYESSGQFSNTGYFELGQSRTRTDGSDTITEREVFLVRQVSGTFVTRYFGTSHGSFHGDVIGTFIAEIDVPPVVTVDISVQGSTRNFYGWYWERTSGSWGSTTNPNPFDPMMQTASGELVFKKNLVESGHLLADYPQYEWDVIRMPDNDMNEMDTPPMLNTGDPEETTPYDVVCRMANVGTMDSVTGHVTVRKKQANHVRTKLYTDRVTYDIDSEGILERFETPEQIQYLEDFGGTPFTSPMFAVRMALVGPDLEPYWPEAQVSVSSLGDRNVVMRYRAGNRNSMMLESMEQNYGALAGPDVSAEHPSRTILFTGKT